MRRNIGPFGVKDLFTLVNLMGGVFAIAGVVDHFSDAVVKNPIVGQKSKNPQLREWHTKNLGRLPGLKFMRTLWVCNISGGPFQFTATKPGKTPLGPGSDLHDRRRRHDRRARTARLGSVDPRALVIVAVGQPAAGGKGLRRPQASRSPSARPTARRGGGLALARRDSPARPPAR